jgi:hypothetical protein
MKPHFYIFIFSILISSCAYQPSYNEQLSQRQMPTTEQSKSEECSWIRSEIARMENISAVLTGSQYELVSKVAARNNIAALNSRAANIGCHEAFSTTQIIEKNNSSSIDECIEACKKNTNRTSAECFDVCNH